MQGIHIHKLNEPSIQEEAQFNSFNDSVIRKDCCSTNYFPLNSVRNQHRRYDTIGERISDNSRMDGGAVLGDCEGFDLLGNKIYIGKASK